MKFRSRDVKKQSDNIANRVSKGALIEGEIRSEADIRVDGRVNGLLNCNAKLVIGPTGVVDGEVHCKDASIEGRMLGVMHVSGTLSLKKTANIEGEIFYKNLAVEEGANVSGTLTMSGSTKILNPVKTNLLDSQQQTA